jgi:hypothetical protein
MPLRKEKDSTAFQFLQKPPSFNRVLKNGPQSIARRISPKAAHQPTDRKKSPSQGILCAMEGTSQSTLTMIDAAAQTIAKMKVGAGHVLL